MQPFLYAQDGSSIRVSDPWYEDWVVALQSSPIFFICYLLCKTYWTSMQRDIYSVIKEWQKRYFLRSQKKWHNIIHVSGFKFVVSNRFQRVSKTETWSSREFQKVPKLKLWVYEGFKTRNIRFQRVSKVSKLKLRDLVGFKTRNIKFQRVLKGFKLKLRVSKV